MLLQFRRPYSSRRLGALIRKGVGVREERWEAPDLDDDEARGAFAERLRGWICDVMGGMRRPYGIDQVAVALACRDPRGRIVCSNALGVLRPIAFYTPDGAERIAGFLDDVRSVPSADRHEIVGAVLSLGDIAYELHRASAA